MGKLINLKSHIQKKGNKMKAYLFPGQGSQKKGMGETLFDEFPEMTATADEVLGYNIKELCLEDPDNLLGQTDAKLSPLCVNKAKQGNIPLL